MVEAHQESLGLPRSPAEPRWIKLAAVLGLGGCAGLLSLYLKNPIIVLVLLAMAFAAFGFAWLMSKPLRIVYLLFTLLPFHIMFMVLLFGFLGLPEGAVRALASWKEAVLVVLVLAIVFGIVLSGKKDFPMTTSDLFAFFFIIQTILYVFLAPILGSKIPMVGRFYGVRDTTMLLGCYFLGRSFTLDLLGLERLLKLILVVGAITVALGLLEWLFLPDQFFVLFGVSTYFKDFLGVNYSSDDWGGGLPSNFWTYMGSLGYVRRSVSVYMSSQGYAVPFLVLIPVATYFLLQRRRGSLRMFAFLSVGLISTITRVTILVCAMLFFVIAKLTGRSGWVTKGLIAAALLTACGLIFSEGVRTLVIETVTWKSDSSRSHLSSWGASIEPILERPWFGYGLSEAGQNSKRFGGKNVGEESTPLRILGEMGALGLFLYLGFWSAYMLEIYAQVRHRPMDDAFKGLGILAIGICLGFLLNSVTADLLSSQYTNFAVGILLGMIRSACKAAPSAIG